MPISPVELLELEPTSLGTLHEKLKLMGVVLGQLALIEVVCDPDAGATAKATAGKVLTQLAGDPHTIAERIKASEFADKSPEDLRAMIERLKSGETSLDQLIEGE